MRFQVISDVHLSFNKVTDSLDTLLSIDSNDAEDTYLMIAGDIEFLWNFADAKRVFDVLSSSYKKIFIVLGNHDFYNTQFTNLSHSQILEQIQIFLLEYPNVYLLNKSIYEDDDVVILGCTLWSHIKTKSLERLMADYVCILNEELKPITIHDTNKWNKECVDWLSMTIQNHTLINHAKPIVVMTHHLPVQDLIQSRYKKTVYCEAYSNNLKDLLNKVDVWICGHSHRGRRVTIDKCLCVMNPYGYQEHTKKEKKTTENAHFVVDCYVDFPKMKFKEIGQ